MLAPYVTPPYATRAPNSASVYRPGMHAEHSQAAPCAPYSFLGRAVPPPGGNDPGSGEPRYLLQFKIPNLRPGSYLYEIWCGVCEKGARGSLISVPASPLWQLQVR